MKRRIVVCCGDMLHMLCQGGVVYDGQLAITPVNQLIDEDYRFCPFCGTKLPFKYEEEKDG